MVLAVHTVAGALLSEMPFNTVIVFLISFISHFFIDMIPHGDEQIFNTIERDKRLSTKKRLIAMDMTVSTLLIIYFFYHSAPSQYPLLFAGIFGNLLPDFLVALYEFFNIKILKKFYKFHTHIHDIIKYQPVYSIFLQIILFIILFKTYL